MSFFRGILLFSYILLSIMSSLAEDIPKFLKLDENIYLVDTIQIKKSIIFGEYDTEYNVILNFNGFPELRAMQKKNIRQLVDDGWALTLPYHNDLLIKKINNPVINDLVNKYNLLPKVMLKSLRLNWRSKHGELYEFTEQPKCFVLFLIKGEYFNSITHGEISNFYIRKINFKDANAYYPFVVPLF